MEFKKKIFKAERGDFLSRPILNPVMTAILTPKGK